MMAGKKSSQVNYQKMQKLYQNKASNTKFNYENDILAGIIAAT